jgi:hypothetical protein
MNLEFQLSVRLNELAEKCAMLESSKNEELKKTLYERDHRLLTFLQSEIRAHKLAMSEISQLTRE